MLARHVRALALVLALGALLCACGASAQVKAARGAVYDSTQATLFAGVVEGVRTKYELGGVDEPAAQLRTMEGWYTAEGARPRRDANDSLLLGDGAIVLSFVVSLVPQDTRWRVTIEPMAARLISGSPQPQPLAADDPGMPGWVENRIDDLYVAIHAKLSPHAVVATK